MGRLAARGESLSRTAHHVPFDHWNGREDIEWRPGSVYSEPTGHTIWSLRYFAGCRRRPQQVRAHVRFGGYLHGHGGTDDAGRMAAEYEASLRNGWRMYAAVVLKADRAGESVDGFVEPDGRTLHSALWDQT